MKICGEDLEKRMIWSKVLQNMIFPLLLLLFPLIKANQGVDLADTGYSLGNYRFLSSEGGIWTLLTFVSNLSLIHI